MSGDACGRRRLRPLVWFGASSDPCDGAPVVSPVTHVTKFLFFSNVIYGNAKLDIVFGFFRRLGRLSGTLLVAFWRCLGSKWVPFPRILGSGGVLGRLGRAVCARTAWLLSRLPPF